ncbi:MAG: hypothetical protein ACR2GQ_02455 [Gemmatimonadota bacterium]
MSEHRGTAWAALAGSVGTLICCALPSLFVLLGFGTTVAAVVSTAPWLVVLSQNKGWVFLAAGGLIVASRVYTHRIPSRATGDAAACPLPLARATRTIWWTSAFLYVAGAFVAFGLGPLLGLLDG